jgi:cysteinyl-tRNA synthetase
MDLKGLDASAKRLKRIRRAARDIARGSESQAREPNDLSSFEAALNDDLDTPRAIESVERALEKAARRRDASKRAEALSCATSAMNILGVDLLGYS